MDPDSAKRYSTESSDQGPDTLPDKSLIETGCKRHYCGVDAAFPAIFYAAAVVLF
jgi:hypothetical protein